MNGSSFRPDHRPRHHNRFRRRPSWNRGVGRGSPRMFEDGEIQTQSPLPPPSPPWRRQQRFPRPFKRHRRNDFLHRSSSPSSPQRSRPPFLGPVPMLELPTRRRSRFDITPDDERNDWRKPEPSDNHSSMRNAPRSDHSRDDLSRLYRSGSNHLSNYGGFSPKNDSIFVSDSRFSSTYRCDLNVEEKLSTLSNPQEQVPTISAIGSEPTLSSGISRPKESSDSKLNSPKFHVPSFYFMSKSSQSDSHAFKSWNGSAVVGRGSRDSVDNGWLSHGPSSAPLVITPSVSDQPSQNLEIQSVHADLRTPLCRVAFGEGLASVLSGSERSPMNESICSDKNACIGVMIPTEQGSDVYSASAERIEENTTQSLSSAAPVNAISLSLESLPNQSDLLLQIQKLDDEIAEIELKVAHQRNLIEEKTSTAANESDNLISDEVMMVIAVSEDSDEILTENRRVAALSAQALAKLNPPWLNERISEGIFFEPLYHEPGQCSMYEVIEMDLLKNRPRLMRAIRHRKLAETNEECQLALQWWNYYRDWRQSISQTEMKSIPPLRHALSADQRTYYASRLAIIHPMLSERNRKVMSWRSRNGLVEDPRAQDQYRKLINPWSDQEKAVFRKKFSKFPKNFVKIATFLPNKSVGDCVAYYYSSKTFVNYKALVKKYRQSLLSRKGIDITAQGHVEGIRSSRIDAPALPTDQSEIKPNVIPRELLKLAEDLSRNNLEVQSGRSRTGKKRRNDGDLSNVSVDTLV